MPKIYSLDRLEQEFGYTVWQESEETGSVRRNRLKKALLRTIQEELSPRQREIVLLYFYEGKNMPSIANELGINKSSVCKGMQRALRTLRHELRYLLPRGQ